jgi:uncharacterized protein involved in exopolysaccharide biosynthesis
MTTSQESSNQSGVPATRDAQFQHYPDDEISLIDLAKILIKRRWWVLGTGSIILLLAFTFALLNRSEGKMYEYTSIYQQAEKSPGSTLVSTSSLLQQVKTLHWPNYRRQYMQEQQIENPDELPFDFEIDTPANTTLVTLTSEALEEDKPEVDVLHEAMVKNINDHQQTAIKRETEKLEKQIERTQGLLAQVQEAAAQAEDAAQALTATEQITSYTERLFTFEQIISYTERLFTLQDKLEDITPGNIVQYTEQGKRVQPDKVSGKLIVALGIVLGGILGIMAAFFVEFAARVRQSLKEEES